MQEKLLKVTGLKVSYFNIVAQANENTVVTEYEPVKGFMEY